MPQIEDERPPGDDERSLGEEARPPGEEERPVGDDERALDLTGERARADADRTAVAPRSSEMSRSPQGAAAGDLEREQSMLPERRQRPPLESAFVRAIATAGVVGIGVALGAILVSQNVAGWIVGLAVALLSVALSAILWSSRRL